MRRSVGVGPPGSFHEVTVAGCRTAAWKVSSVKSEMGILRAPTDEGLSRCPTPNLETSWESDLRETDRLVGSEGHVAVDVGLDEVRGAALVHENRSMKASL